MRKPSLKLAAVAAALLIGASASAQTIIYDNSADPAQGLTGDNPVAGETTLTLGDVVSFAGGANTLGSFQLEYFTAGAVNAVVNLWALDGTSGQPSSILYTSGSLALPAGQHSFDSGAISQPVPDTIAWTVSFSGVDAGETAALYFRNGPTVGTSPNFAGNPYYLRENTDGSWDYLRGTPLGSVSDNLSARFTAVPEPSTWALLTRGFGGFWFFASSRKP
jgi:hypothetical protein